MNTRDCTDNKYTKTSPLVSLTLCWEEQLSGHAPSVWFTSLLCEAGWLPGCLQLVWKLQRCSYCTDPWSPPDPSLGLLRTRLSKSLCSPGNSTRQRWCGPPVDCSRPRSHWAPPGHSSRTSPLWWGPSKGSGPQPGLVWFNISHHDEHIWKGWNGFNYFTGIHSSWFGIREADLPWNCKTYPCATPGRPK